MSMFHFKIRTFKKMFLFNMERDKGMFKIQIQRFGFLKQEKNEQV